jgi:phosphoribosylaminoimidazole-succinocarboxamide synthase
MTKLRVKTKEIIPSGQVGLVIQQFTHGKGSTGNRSKAALANEISAHLFEYLNGYRIPTYYVARASPTGMLVRELVMLPLKVVVWNAAFGKYARKFLLRSGTVLPTPVIEHYWKSDRGEKFVNDFHVYALGLATPEQLRAVNRLASRVNILLRSYFGRRALKLVSIALEFGVAGGQVMVADEISPRTCVLSEPRKGRGGGEVLLGGDPANTAAYIEFKNRLFRTS